MNQLVTPAAEAERLLALGPYKALEADHNPIFTQLAQLAARLFGVPVAQVSLVDADEVRYPGNVGEPHLPDCLRREDSLCAVAVYQPGPIVFADLLHQPSAWLPPDKQQGVGFYAGAPLRTRAGQPIGMLCLIDQQPRTFGPGQQALLTRLAGVAMQLLDLQQLAGPAQAPAVWEALAGRIELSLQRIDTLTAMMRWQDSPAAPAALAFGEATQQERLLIVQDIEYQVWLSFEQLRQVERETGAV